jgi:hypothetical protein
MSGGNDPNNRAPMVWDKAKWNAGLRETVRRSVALRHAHLALRGETVETLFAPEGGQTVALLRRGGGETAVTVFNASDTEQTITIPAGGLPDAPAFRDAWTGGTVRPENGTLTLKMAPLSAAILFPERTKAPARGK